jgi:hypothetical protein
LSNQLIYAAFLGDLPSLIAKLTIQNVPALPQDFPPAADAKEVIDGRLALGRTH